MKYSAAVRPKHDMSDFRLYQVHCPSCEAEWEIEKRIDTEVWCPFCEADEPCKYKEVK